jgi:predicted oxidoreductase
MKYVELGRSGLQASAVVLGCMRIDNMDEKTLTAHLENALELGVNHFDHADIYGGGKCEESFGKVLAHNPGMREKMILQSKCGIRKNQYDFSKEHILSSVDGILSRLGVEYLDILLLHRPDALMDPAEVAEAFSQLETTGKVRRFGVSNFNPRQMELLQSGVRAPLEINQLQFGLMHTGMIDHALCANTEFEGSVDRDGEILDYCRLKGVTVQAWSPFQYGFFEGVFVGNDKFPQLNETLNELAEKYGLTPTGLAAAWIMRHPANMQVIAGTTNAGRLKEICDAADVTISREDWYRLYLAAGNMLP